MKILPTPKPSRPWSIQLNGKRGLIYFNVRYQGKKYDGVLPEVVCMAFAMEMSKKLVKAGAW